MVNICTGLRCDYCCLDGMYLRQERKKNVDIELSYRCNCLDYNVIYQNSVPQWVQVDCHIIVIRNHLVNINLGIVVDKKDFF